MSIVIKGMEMPKNCDDCWALDDYGDYPRCRITEEQRGYNFPIREKRMDKCPLIELPPHGDLIDRDSLNNAFTGMRFAADGLLVHYGDREDWFIKGSEVETLLTNASTIIESEGEDG